MDLYEALLLIHIAAAIAWLGSGLMLSLQMAAAARTRDHEHLEGLITDSSGLSEKVFLPASFTVLIFGILLVVDGPWSFGELWIVLALCGYAGTTAAGILIFKPASDRIAAAIERDGGLTEATAAETRRILTIGRADLIALYLVLADMVIKPTGDDVVVLGAMAAILIGAVAWFGTKARAMGGREAETPVPA